MTALDRPVMRLGAEPTLSTSPPSQDAQRLIESCQGLVRSLAWTIHRKLPPHVELDDLIAYGQVGLAQAAHSFDPARTGRFTTYAYYRIRGAIFDGLSQMSWFSRHDYHAAKYEQMANHVLELESESPGDGNEQQVESGVRWLTGVTAALSIAYLATGLETEQNGICSGRSLVENSGPAEHAMQAEVAGKLRELVDALPAEAGQLIRITYYEGSTLAEAARRLGISKAWASRLHAKTLRRLACALRRLSAV